MCRNCNCEEQKSSCFDTCCEKTKACDNNFSTSCIFYKLENQSNSRLYTIKAENGTPLNTVLEEIDKRLNLISTPDFTAFKIPYLKGKYNITNIKQFSESVSGELFKLSDKDANHSISINALEIATTTNTTDISKLKYPQITDSAAAGFTVHSDVKTVLQKLTDKVGTLSVTNVVSPSINSIETSTVKFTLTNTLNHTISARVKISEQVGNTLQVRPDGLFVAPISIPNNYQTLSLSGNQLSLTNGGTVTLPAATLTLNGTILGIVGSPTTFNLASLLTNSQQTLTANNSTSISIVPSGTLGHTITATVIRSGDSGNVLELRNTGVYVGKTTAQEVLNEINVSAPNSTLRTTLCSVITASCADCYTYYVKNVTGGLLTFNYVNCSGITVGVPIIAGGTQVLNNVRSIPSGTVFNGDYNVFFLGKT